MRKREWSFECDEQFEQFCLEIAAEMLCKHGISEEEALGRINRHWAGQSFFGEDIVYHDDAETWANNIYYGADSFWWIDGTNPEPAPFP
ncbi:MAG: hypothetical protein HC897_05965 [Thermoanaerobaculia bacterium]|nr:hypothetical protein [Thermoanaerobaculia bacterium]